jgi:diguanylate cyclase (GGDEF)-like protein
MSPPAASRGREARATPPADAVPSPESMDLADRLHDWQRMIRRRLATRSALAHVLLATHATLDPQRVADFLVSWAPGWWPLSIWAVVTSDVDGQVSVLSERGVTSDLAPSVQAVGGWVMHSGEAFASGDLRREDRLPGPSAAVAAIGFVLSGRDQPVGALVGLERQPSASDLTFAPRVRAAWTELLAPAGLALDNALRLEKAEALSVTDDLTRLYNSRFMNLSLRRETKRAGRTGTALSLLFIDLDGFKAVNDTYGHLSGSRALVEAADVIRGCARESDVVARFGGDEFAVILPDTDCDGATMVAERIRDRIAAHSFLTSDQLNVRLTASVGIATLPDVAASADELVQAADRAMYKVKVSGKNGIHLAAEGAA